MTNSKLIAFNVSDIKQEAVLTAWLDLAVKIKKLDRDNTTAVNAFIVKARKEAGWPVAARRLLRALENNKLAAIVAELAMPVIRLPKVKGLKIKIPTMIIVPAGKFKMGNKESITAQLERTVTITKAFALGEYEVTNEEYNEYLRSTGQSIRQQENDSKKARFPVGNVNWYRAIKYCQWLSEKTGESYRLPTEAEWEYAARGTKGRRYPWGDAFDAGKCNLGSNKIKRVDAYPGGAGPFGHQDMAGNVREWTNDWYAEEYDAKKLINPKGPKGGTEKVIRSGSCFGKRQNPENNYYRGHYNPRCWDGSIGFRVARDL